MLAEIETDKATMEVEAVDEGTLTAILVPEGTEGVAVNAVIAQLMAARTARRTGPGACPEGAKPPRPSPPPPSIMAPPPCRSR